MYKSGQPIKATITRDGKATHYAGQFVRVTEGSRGKFVVMKQADGKEISIRPVHVTPV